MSTATPSRDHAAVAACLFFATMIAAGAGAATVTPLDHIVAVVNDDVIVASELEQRVQRIRRQLAAQNTSLPPDDVLRRQILEREILDRIQLQLAAERGISIDDPSLNRAVGQIAQQNRLSLSEFRAVIERDGFDFQAFREDMRREMAISRLRNREVLSRISVSEQEIQEFLERHGAPGQERRSYRLGHILIAVPEGASAVQIDQARAKAETTVSELRGGADFAETALAVSAGQQALAGGDLGWRQASELPTLFAEPARGLRVGEISEPIRSASGFHVIKLLDTRGDERRVVTQTHARHILLRTDALVDEEEARRRLAALRERILAGADFAALARANSQDPVTAAQGGDLGWAGPGRMVPQFEEVMNGLAPSEISEPFGTRFGWHIVQVLARREHDDTAEFQRAQVIQEIRNRKAEEELELWLRRLRDEAYVELRTEE